MHTKPSLFTVIAVFKEVWMQIFRFKHSSLSKRLVAAKYSGNIYLVIVKKKR